MYFCYQNNSFVIKIVLKLLNLTSYKPSCIFETNVRGGENSSD